MTPIRLVLLVVAFCCAGLTVPAGAVEPGEMLKDPALEARARALSSELRCLVCQNESIDDSNAELAHELRTIVRQRIVAGDSNAAIKQFLVDRYGEFVLLRPNFGLHTLLLWTLPFLALLLGVVLSLRTAQRRRRSGSSALSAEERDKLDHLLADNG